MLSVRRKLSLASMVVVFFAGRASSTSPGTTSTTNHKNTKSQSNASPSNGGSKSKASTKTTTKPVTSTSSRTNSHHGSSGSNVGTHHNSKKPVLCSSFTCPQQFMLKPDASATACNLVNGCSKNDCCIAKFTTTTPHQTTCAEYKGCPNNTRIVHKAMLCNVHGTCGKDTCCEDCEDMNCYNCSTSKSTCNECMNYTYLRNGKCEQKCPTEGYFTSIRQPLGRVCVKCAQHCITCENISTCKVCGKNYAEHDGKCVTNCPQNYYKHTQTSTSSGHTPSVCNRCGPNCSACSDGTSCNQCTNSAYLHNGSCTTECPSRFFEFGHGTEGRVCTPCQTNCHTCDNASSCQKCKVGTYLYKGTCLPRCPSNFFSNVAAATLTSEGLLGGSCSPCSTNCETCANSSTCTTCRDGYFANVSRMCEPCLPECGTCVSRDKCIACVNGNAFMQGQCLKTCPRGYSLSNATTTSPQCIPCPNNCTSCHASSCTECAPKMKLSGGKCILFACPKLYPVCSQSQDCTSSSCAAGHCAKSQAATLQQAESALQSYSSVQGDGTNHPCSQDYEEPRQCPRKYPVCFSDGDCVTASCQNGCASWLLGQDYISGDGAGNRCTQSYNVTCDRFICPSHMGKHNPTTKKCNASGCTEQDCCAAGFSQALPATTGILTTTTITPTTTITTTTTKPLIILPGLQVNTSTYSIKLAKAGDTKLDVVSTHGFAVGSHVIIDLATPSEESNAITGFGSIVLQSPLKFDHDVGAKIYEVPATKAQVCGSFYCGAGWEQKSSLQLAKNGMYRCPAQGCTRLQCCEKLPTTTPPSPCSMAVPCSTTSAKVISPIVITTPGPYSGAGPCNPTNTAVKRFFRGQGTIAWFSPVDNSAFLGFAIVMCMLLTGILMSIRKFSRRRTSTQFRLLPEDSE